MFHFIFVTNFIRDKNPLYSIAININFTISYAGIMLNAFNNPLYWHNRWVLTCVKYAPVQSDRYSLIVVISDLMNLLVSYKTISENKKQLAFHFS